MDWDTLAADIEGEVLSGIFDRGRYATDASIYQIMPAGVVVPRTFADVETALGHARAAGVPVTARGGGTSQAGQTVNSGLILDFSKHLNGILELDVARRRAVVQPGIVLDDLNRQLRRHGLWFPVDVSTASRATIGGMAANNSCGSRSIKYGLMRDNVLAIDTLMADGSRTRFAETPRDANDPLFQDLINLGTREADEIASRFPKIQRRVGGYNIDALVPGDAPLKLSDLMVGSEGTLAISERVEIKLSPILTNKALGVCHFPTFWAAMDAAQHIVKLGPVAVELVDHNMIALGREIPQFRPIVDEFVKGDPAALLLVEFAERNQADNIRRLNGLADLMSDLGGDIVRAEDSAFQSRIWAVRTQGLNIMMSMREAGKPVSFVEDCAVALPDLADFTDRLTGVFRKHGTDGTWYAHASVGLLHVRPVLNLKSDLGVHQLRAIAEESFDIVADYKGSHSGEHGDGIVRSEFHERMFGTRMVDNFAEVKSRFDPGNVLNPGKITAAPKMDDRTLMRFKPDYAYDATKPAFDWSGWPGGLHGAVEMCNNNGACRKLAGGAMCPSYRATRNERDLTRGRANTLRLALTGQLGADALASDDMAETMKLCVGCKACKRECPMSVDMAKMKIEVAAARAKIHGVALREKMVAYLPRYAPYASRLRALMNLRDQIPGLAWISEALTGLSAQRTLPVWRRAWKGPAARPETEVALFADTFNRYFEPENLEAAYRVLASEGTKVGDPTPKGARPLCSGRTFLAAGMVEAAKTEIRRTMRAFQALPPDIPIVGLEPSCILTFRDEAPRLLDDWDHSLTPRIKLFEEYIVDQPLALKPVAERALLHGHCHQKAEDAMGPVAATLAKIPDLDVQMIESSCCGMAGAFGYQSETIEVSKAMGELSLLPTVRAADPDDLIVADGTSCRHQIADGTGRTALHVARVLEMALAAR
ncbi:MAG: FAD-binding and (Fe-S)-binding domain-containing protein [Pseudomonadota bacterium]